jgi:integrase
MGVQVRQKVKGKGNPWWVFISHNGKRTSRKVGDKKSAEAVASTIRAKLQLGEFGFEEQKPVPTFKEYSSKWIDGYVRSQCRESTFDEYESVLRNHVLPVFKGQGIDSITKGDIRDLLLAKHNNGLSIKRTMLIKDVISGVFNFALDEELIAANPTTGITKRLFPNSNGKKKTVEKTEVFTKDELDLFLETCEIHFKEYYLFFLMAARTGMRLGELLALKWDDIDFNSNYIWVKRSYRRGRFTRPKNGKSRRVDMSDRLIMALRAYLSVRKREDLKQGSGEMVELVLHRQGQVIEQNFIRRQYKRILRKAGLRYVKPHGLRHAFCTHLLSAGVSPYYVSQQAGHSSINITCDIYGSWISTDENRHVNLLDALHSSAPPPHPTEIEKPQPIKITAKTA